MKTSILLVLLVSATLLSFSQSDRELVLKTLSDQSDCWNKTDIDCFMQGYWKSDSLMFIGSKGITYGWQATADRYAKSYPDATAMGKLKFDIMETKPIGADGYFVVGKFYLTRTIGDLEGYFTLVFRKIEGQWVIVADHTG